jgi:hypothetical protein
MMLGDLIARFQDPGVAAEALLSLDDLALVTRVTNAAAAQGLTVGEFATQSVDRFVAHAGTDAWVTMMGRMAKVDDPGRVFLQFALAHGLA